MISLTDPLQAGAICTENRIWMAPLTQCRATREHVPTPLMAEHYAQRAHAGLIIAESTGISREGMGWPYAPGIYTQEQIAAWKDVTAAVHAHGGKIVVQLFHMGRASHSSVTGVQPVSSSATTYPIAQETYDGPKPAQRARALTVPEIQRIVQDFGRAAENALEAGFDGVQVHAANGYLVDQFLRDSTNHRTDEYGGSIPNQVRFLEEVVAEVAAVVGGNRTAIRFSPNGSSAGVHDSHGEALFTEVAHRLNKYDLAFVELREVGPNDTFGHTDEPKRHAVFNKFYKGILVLNQEFNRQRAERAVESGIASAIAFGRPFISNPDLVERIKHRDDAWEPADESTWYIHGPEGYTDYPAKYAD